MQNVTTAHVVQAIAFAIFLVIAIQLTCIQFITRHSDDIKIRTFSVIAGKLATINFIIAGGIYIVSKGMYYLSKVM